MKQNARTWALDILSFVLGSAMVAAGLVLFTIPNDIAPGGVSGLATALAYLSPVSVGVWTLLLNIPLVALAWWKLGFRPLIKTIIATLLLSGFIELFLRILPPYSNNVLLASVLGGVLCGAGMGIIFVRGATTGGTDLISLLLNRVFPNASVGSLLLIVDATVVVFAVLVFRNIEVALYSIVTIFATTRTIDAIMQGVDHAKVIYIVTERGDDILALLADELGRGVTVLQGRGGYTRRDKNVLMLVTHRNSFAQTLKSVKTIDKKAFIFVTDATEVHGEGFKPMD
ncbi:MAG: YitT family protein [Eubacteriales bacterium]|nr:YitT family protein [Eubacteriales bacterium]